MFQAARVPMSVYMCNVTLIFRENRLSFRYNDQRYSRFYVDLPEDTEAEVLPGKFTFRGRDVDFSVTLSGKNTFIMRGTKCLTIRRFPQADYDADFALRFENRIYLRDTGGEHMHYITVRAGEAELHQTRPHGIIHSENIHLNMNAGEDGVWEIVFTKRRSQSGYYRESCPAFDDCVRTAENSFAEWVERMQPRDELDKEAIYVLWANTMAPQGFVDAPAVCPSKNHMDRSWNADCNYVAMALAQGIPELAVTQLLLNFNHIDEEGVLPDAVSPYEIIWNSTKLPLQGYALRYMLRKNPEIMTPEQERRYYETLSRNVQWWLTGREYAPCIWHGNESGSGDNATCFDRYPAAQTPYVHAQLALLCEQLSRLASRLGYEEESLQYLAKSRELGEQINTYFFDGERLFVRPLDDLTPFYSDGSHMYQAIVAHEFLNDTTKAAIVRHVRERLFCDYGIISEPVDSPEYIGGGYESYFRGSVWWMDQIIFSLALREMGENEFADEIVKRFRRGLEKAGFAETIHAETGEGNCCPGYSAMAAAWLIVSRQ